MTSTAAVRSGKRKPSSSPSGPARRTVKRYLTAFLVLIALSILISLGLWQLQRKAWKEALIADLNSRAHATTVDAPDPSDWKNWDPARDEFRHVRASGTYLNDKEISVYGLMSTTQAGVGKEPGSLQGSYVFTPLRLEDGSIIFVNRGFVPKDGGAEANRITTPVQVNGILRAPERRGWFVPENDPGRNQWFTRDTDAMAAALGIGGQAPFYIEADASEDASAPWPRGGVTREITLKNDHLQYALTWFGLALTLLGVVGHAAFRNGRRPDRKELPLPHSKL